MKTTIKKAMQLLMLLSMLLPAIPCFAAQKNSTISTENKNTVIASTPRILVMAAGVIVDASNGEALKPVIGPISSGSGILIHKDERDGFVLTNAHVLVEEGKPMKLKEKVEGKDACFIPQKVYYLVCFNVSGGDPRFYVAQEVVCKELKRTEDAVDLAVLRIPSDTLPEPLMIDPRKLDATQPVVAVGYPGVYDRLTNILKANTTQNPLVDEIIRKFDSFAYTNGYITIRLNVSDRDFINPAVTMGNIYRYDETPGKPQRVIHGAAIAEGCSGGPLLDPSTGYVVGINTWTPPEHAPGSISQSAATMIGFLNSHNIPYLLAKSKMGNVWLIAGIAAGALLLIFLIILIANSGSSTPAITLYSEGRTFPLTLKQLRKGVLLGRSSSADVIVPQKTVSARHARIYVRDDRLYIEDIGSKGGTKVNGTALTPHSPVPFHPGSSIMLCNIEVRVR